MKVRVKMLKDDRGSQTGAIVEQFEKGKEYDVSEDLALCFVSTKSAEIIGDAASDEQDASQEQKDAGDAAENKDAGTSPEKKSRRGKRGEQ